MKSVIRVAIGFALFAGGLTFLVYGIAQAITTGSCGSDSYGNSFGPSCPSGMGPMIVLMVLGTFAAIIGLGLAAGGGRGAGRLLLALGVAVVAGVVLGFVDLNPDDTRPGPEIVLAVLVPLVVLVLPGMARPQPVTQARRSQAEALAGVMAARVAAAAAAAPPPPPPSSSTPPRATTTANAETIAARLRQLDQLRDSGLLDDAAYKERRTQILAEL